MDEKRPQRRRELTPREKKALEKQRQRERELARKKARMDAKYREEARLKARREGRDSHIVVEIPARPNPPRRRKKSLPDIIERETDKRIRDLDPTDHKDGYYVNEVGVRREQARKQRQKRQRKQPKPISPKVRRRRRIIASVSIIMLILVVGIALSLTVLFKSENIVIKNNKYYDDETVLKTTNVSVGDNIFLATMFGDRDSISDTLPFIKKAKISFEIPSTVIITLKNEEPYYTLKSDNKYYLVSEENRILEKVKKKQKGMMFVNAPTLKSTEAGEYVEFEKDNYTAAMDEITESLIKNDYGDVTQINIKRISNITITYDDRILIRLGLPDDLDYKIRTAFTIINKKLDPNGAKTIKGSLNVSKCNTTKKSYYDPGGYGDENATEMTVAPETTEPETVRTTFVPAYTEATTDPYAAGDMGQYYTQYPESTESIE
ncbi:MAG: FtsQ-type POTRA domain-containing protein [Ruminococcus sp.]|nr:FtsQ-type POTRA domain-containing protein [Ruminococcus sp.]